jgi:DnaJ-class molecular chaperone
MQKDNHFNVIAAHPVSTEREIKHRYERRCAEFDPSLYPNADPQHLDTLAKIRARLTRAYEVLGDREQRQHYRRQICSDDQLMTFVDLQVRKAEVALRMREQFEEAIDLAASALDIDAGSVAARLLLAGALAGAGRTREAREQLRAIGAVPPSLRHDYEELRRKLG